MDTQDRAYPKDAIAEALVKTGAFVSASASIAGEANGISTVEIRTDGPCGTAAASFPMPRTEAIEFVRAFNAMASSRALLEAFSSIAADLLELRGRLARIGKKIIPTDIYG